MSEHKIPTTLMGTRNVESPRDLRRQKPARALYVFTMKYGGPQFSVFARTDADAEVKLYKRIGAKASTRASVVRLDTKEQQDAYYANLDTKQ